MNACLKCLKSTASCFAMVALVSLFVSCKKTTPPDTKYIKDFHVTNFNQTLNMIEEDNLALYVDYSTCIAEGMKTSPFYIKLVPSFVEAAKGRLD